MMTGQITDTSPSDTPDEETNDAWRGWAPVPGTGPHAQQERHSPTEPVVVRLSGSRQAQTGRRRIVDARLWAAMTPLQQDAALAVVFTFQSMSRGLGFAQAQLDRMPGTRGGGNPVEPQAVMMSAYFQWAQDCPARGVSHAMIVDILVIGMSLDQCDRARRVRKGTARANLLMGLDLYARARGWRV